MKEISRAKISAQISKKTKATKKLNELQAKARDTESQTKLVKNTKFARRIQVLYYGWLQGIDQASSEGKREQEYFVTKYRTKNRKIQPFQAAIIKHLPRLILSHDYKVKMRKEYSKSKKTTYLICRIKW